MAHQPFYVVADGDPNPGTSDVLCYGDLTLDPGTREVRRGRMPVELTPREFELLTLFLHNPRQVLSRSQILAAVWGYDFGTSNNSVDVYVGYLRRKLERSGLPRLVQTIYGIGYALREQPPSEL